MRLFALIASALLGACLPTTGERVLPEVGAACEVALKSLVQGKVTKGYLLVTYKTKNGRTYAYTWPRNLPSGNIDAVCTADIYNRKITKMLVDVTSDDGVEVRKDFLPSLKQELRTF